VVRSAVYWAHNNESSASTEVSACARRDCVRDSPGDVALGRYPDVRTARRRLGRSSFIILIIILIEKTLSNPPLRSRWVFYFPRPGAVGAAKAMNDESANLRENLCRLPRAAWVLFFGTFLNKFGTFVLPFLAIYLTRLGYSSTQAGLAIGAYGVGTMGACVIGGWLADQFGRRRTIVLSMSAGAVAMLSLSQARSLPLIVVLSGFAGLTGELYRPASSALLADLVPAGQRVIAFAAYRVALNAGFAFGPATAGLMAKHSYHWLFLGDAVTSLLFGLVAWIALPRGGGGMRGGAGLRATWSVLLNDAAFRRVLGASLAVGLVFVQVFSTMSLKIRDDGFSPSIYGLMISLNGALVVLFELPLTTITRRYPARWMLALGYGLIGIGFASNALTHALPGIMLTVLLFTAGEMVAMPVAGAFVADLAPAHQRGLYMGAYGLIWSLAFIGGPSLGMALFATNPAALWSTCGLLGLAAASIIMAEPRTRRCVGSRSEGMRRSEERLQPSLRKSATSGKAGGL
jgi:MFS family permease